MRSTNGHIMHRHDTLNVWTRTVTMSITLHVLPKKQEIPGKPFVRQFWHGYCLTHLMETGYSNVLSVKVERTFSDEES